MADRLPAPSPPPWAELVASMPQAPRPRSPSTRSCRRARRRGCRRRPAALGEQPELLQPAAVKAAGQVTARGRLNRSQLFIGRGRRGLGVHGQHDGAAKLIHLGAVGPGRHRPARLPPAGRRSRPTPSSGRRVPRRPADHRRCARLGMGESLVTSRSSRVRAA